MISTTKASEERHGKGDERGSEMKSPSLSDLLTSGQSPQTRLKLIPHQVSSLKVPVKMYKENVKTFTTTRKKWLTSKKFTTTLIQIHFSSHKTAPFLKEKRKTAIFLVGKGTFTGTGKLVLDINLQKNDAR